MESDLGGENYRTDLSERSLNSQISGLHKWVRKREQKYTSKRGSWFGDLFLEISNLENVWSIEEILSLCKYEYTSRSEGRGLAGDNDLGAGVVTCRLQISVYCLGTYTLSTLE